MAGLRSTPPVRPPRTLSRQLVAAVSLNGEVALSARQVVEVCVAREVLAIAGQECSGVRIAHAADPSTVPLDRLRGCINHRCREDVALEVPGHCDPDLLGDV